MKKLIAAAAAFVLISPSVLAADNFYEYNKFIYNIVRPETGICDTEASFVGHEVEYSDVNDYFRGLISAFDADIDSDGTSELITVEGKNISVYTSDGRSIEFCDEYKRDLIGNSGDSYANVFIKNSSGTEYLGIETFFAGGGQNGYQLEIFRLDPESNSLQSKAYVYQLEGNGELYQSVSKDGVSVFSHTNSSGIVSTVDPNGFASAYMAAKDALWNVGITDDFLNRPDRMEYDSSQYGTAHRLSDYVHDMQVMTYITGSGVRTSMRPIVIFEDNSDLQSLLTPAYDITVLIDGTELEFEDQEPVIINDRTLVPVRAIFEALGADVSWLPEGMKVVANTASVNVTMTIGENDYFVNGERHMLDVPPRIMNDRTLVPARAVAEAFGCLVNWDDTAKTVIINTAGQAS